MGASWNPENTAFWWALLKKIGRYLLYRPRMVLRYKWQARPGCIDGYTDSDWAGCTNSRKSTSGAVIMVGNHVVKSYSRQQKVLALSSAEAETYGMVACSAEVLGIQACAKDMGLGYTASIYADASAALGIVQRRGVGKVRHIRTQSLWLQEAHATKRLGFEKIDGSRNPADLMTKHLSDTLQQRHLDQMSAIATTGRAESAPTLNAVDEEDDRYFFGVVFEDENEGILKKSSGGVSGAGSEGAAGGKPKRVRFDRVVRCKRIVAYSSIYGQHPNKFDFDSFGRKVARKLQQPAPHNREVDSSVVREAPVNALGFDWPTARIVSRPVSNNIFVSSLDTITVTELVTVSQLPIELSSSVEECEIQSVRFDSNFRDPFCLPLLALVSREGSSETGRQSHMRVRFCPGSRDRDPTRCFRARSLGWRDSGRAEKLKNNIVECHTQSRVPE